MKLAMKNDPSKEYVAYSIYWGTSNEVYQRLHQVIIPEDGTGGFSVLAESEVDIVDPDMDHYFITKDGYGMDCFIHKAAYPSKEFFAALANNGALDKVDQLFERMRQLGLEP